MEIPLWKLGKVAKVELVLKGHPHKWILNARLIAKKGFGKNAVGENSEIYFLLQET